MATVSSRFSGHIGSRQNDWKQHLQEMAAAFVIAGGGVATLLLAVEAVKQHRSPLALAARIPTLVGQSFRTEPPLAALSRAEAGRQMLQAATSPARVREAFAGIVRVNT